MESQRRQTFKAEINFQRDLIKAWNRFDSESESRAKQERNKIKKNNNLILTGLTFTRTTSGSCASAAVNSNPDIHPVDVVYVTCHKTVSSGWSEFELETCSSYFLHPSKHTALVLSQIGQRVSSLFRDSWCAAAVQVASSFFYFLAVKSAAENIHANLYS